MIDARLMKMLQLSTPWVLLLACLVNGSGCHHRETVEPEPLRIEGAHFVGDAACQSCHAEISATFPDNVHAQLQPVGVEALQNFLAGSKAEGAGSFQTAGDVAPQRVHAACESCHGPGSRHIEGDGKGGMGHILQPGRDAEACYRCHELERSDFLNTHHHPVPEGRMSCVDCHDPHQGPQSIAGGLSGWPATANGCARCHQEVSRPFLFEHEALREGCQTCHDPHGQSNRHLLHQPDANLCLKCHAQTQLLPGRVFIGSWDHTALLSRGTCWSAGCHTAVHGSNVHPKLRY